MTSIKGLEGWSHTSNEVMISIGYGLRLSNVPPSKTLAEKSIYGWISSSRRAHTVCISSMGERRKLPVLLFDVMDTIVRDPFYEDIPAFFRMSMKELLETKHPTAWGDFEKGLIDEEELAKNFFKDGRHLDLQGLKQCMKNGYSYLDGMKALLHKLRKRGYEMHAITNYPVWYTSIEEKLKLSDYVNWTFCSCFTGKRKPDADVYLEAVQQLGVHSSDCIFIDDRMINVTAAVNVGMVGIHFKNAVTLEHDLLLRGVNTKETIQDSCYDDSILQMDGNFT